MQNKGDPDKPDDHAHDPAEQGFPGVRIIQAARARFGMRHAAPFRVVGMRFVPAVQKAACKRHGASDNHHWQDMTQAKASREKHAPERAVRQSDDEQRHEKPHSAAAGQQAVTETEDKRP